LTDSRKLVHNRTVRTAFDAEPLLRGAALRVPRPRAAVLTSVHEHPYADTDSVIRIVRGDLGEVSTQAVYDVLRALTAAGLVRCIEPAAKVVYWGTCSAAP
jgi:Fur family ferric uptake transcriptional regulator